MDIENGRGELAKTLVSLKKGEHMAPVPGEAMFRVRSVGRRAQDVEVKGCAVTAGRAEVNQIVLPDDDVSAVHVEFRLVDGGVEFRDLGSTNGTWIRGARVDVGFLPAGHEVQIGRYSVGIREVREVEEPCAARRVFGEFLGRGTKMGRMFALLQRVAETDYPVLLVGETGTGKELLAREVHRLSGRAEGRFVAINCGALAPTLIESELFGHEVGAFPGAESRRLGLFERARGGTVFLDEIEALPVEQQSKLLRVLDPGVVRRLGEDTTERPVDVRVIASATRDLRKLMNAGEFLDALFFRLDVASVSIPPLRERASGNVSLLARAFAQKVGDELGVELSFSRKALVLLDDHEWPGNGRELLSVVRRCALSLSAVGNHGGRVVIPRETLRVAIRGGGERRPRKQRAKSVDAPIDTSIPLSAYVLGVQRRYIEAVIEECGGKKIEAAKRIGMSRSQLYRLISPTP